MDKFNDIKFTDLSPLRYPGSKRKIVKYIYEILKHNNLNPNVLIEPFVGGASVALNFLENRIVEKIIISDKDKLIFSFWYVLFAENNYLIDFIKRVRVDTDNYYKYKEIAKNPDSNHIEELAEACLFLNRTSFSGILKNDAGPIGGKYQKSDYKIDCRFNKESIIEKIQKFASLSRKVKVLPYDWERTIDYSIKWSKSKKRLNRLVFYLDPPFYNKANKLYRCYFSPKQHKKLYKKLVSLNFDWILSYDNAIEIKKLYKNNKFLKWHLDIPYSINSHSKRAVKELVITPLELPSIE